MAESGSPDMSKSKTDKPVSSGLRPPKKDAEKFSSCPPGGNQEGDAARSSNRSPHHHRAHKTLDVDGDKPDRRGSRRTVVPTKAPTPTIDDSGVPPAILAEIRAVFELFDADGSGAIDPKEIRTQMGSLGFEADNTTIYQLISDLDSDGSQTLEFEEFFGLMKDQLRVHEPGYNTRLNINDMFEFIDDLDPSNRDGKIDSSNLRRLANVLGDSITDAEIEVMIKGADRDGKGYVSSEDFYELMVTTAKKLDEATQEDVDAAGKVDERARRQSVLRTRSKAFSVSALVSKFETSPGILDHSMPEESPSGSSRRGSPVQASSSAAPTSASAAMATQAAAAQRAKARRESAMVPMSSSG